MLTPEEVKQYKEVYGIGSSGITVPSKEERKKNYFERVGESIGQEFEGAKKSVTEGMDITRETKNPIRGALRTGLGIAGAGIRTAFSPITELFSPVLEPLAKGAIESSPAAQKAIEGLNAWAEQHPEASENLKNILEIAGTVTGTKLAVKGAQTGAKSAKNAFQAVKTGAKEILTESPEAALAKSSKRAIEAITPDVSDLPPTEYAELLRAGRITPKTATSPAKINLSPKETALAAKYKEHLQLPDATANNNNILKEISNKDYEVGEFLRKDTRVYVKNDLRKSIVDRLSKVTDVMVPKENLAAARKDLIDTVMSRIPESNTGRTYEKLWRFRKDFDQTIDSKINAFGGSPTLKKEMARELRNAIQDFISANTKNGVYAAKMKDMSELYDLTEMLATKAVKEKNLSGIQKLIKENPKSAYALKWIVGSAVGAGAVGGASAILQ